jgi:fatty acid desaturase
MATVLARDYSLMGGNSEAAYVADNGTETGMGAEWFSCRIPRKTLKELMKRDDRTAGIDYATWLALLVGSGLLAYFAWGTWWAVPAFLVYGTIYSSSDARWHELSHGTPFRTRRVNEAFYHLASFMTLREAYLWRWSHSRHHTHTIIVGQDPEIAVPRPPDLVGIVLDVFHLKSGLIELKKIFLHAAGVITADAREFVPLSEQKKMIRSSRVYVAIMLAVAAGCVAAGSILPAMFVVTPRFYGGWLHQLQGLTQHAGLAEDVYDHRLNTRTVYMNPVYRFLYQNMNYHVEHHMFPMVPYYALPKLHELIKDQCPPPYPSLLAAYREIVPALIRQWRDPTYYVKRELPLAAAA